MFDNRTFCRTFWIICFIFRSKNFSRTHFRTNKMRLDCLYLNKREFSLEGSWIRKAEYQTDIKWILSRFSRHRSRISQHLTLFFPRRVTIISAEYILIRSKWWWRPRANNTFKFQACCSTICVAVLTSLQCCPFQEMTQSRKSFKILKISKIWMFTNVQNSKIFDVLD